MRTPARPPLDGLKKRLDRTRAEATPRDGFLRETFVLPRSDARLDDHRKLVRTAGRRHRIHHSQAAGRRLTRRGGPKRLRPSHPLTSS